MDTDNKLREALHNLSVELEEIYRGDIPPVEEVFKLLDQYKLPHHFAVWFYV